MMEQGMSLSTTHASPAGCFLKLFILSRISKHTVRIRPLTMDSRLLVLVLLSVTARRAPRLAGAVNNLSSTSFSLPSGIGGTFSAEMPSLPTLKTTTCPWTSAPSREASHLDPNPIRFRYLTEGLFEVLHSAPQLPYLALNFTISPTLHPLSSPLHCLS